MDFFLIAVRREYKTIGDRTVHQSANNGYERAGKSEGEVGQGQGARDRQASEHAIPQIGGRSRQQYWHRKGMRFDGILLTSYQSLLRQNKGIGGGVWKGEGRWCFARGAKYQGGTWNQGGTHGN